MNIVTISFDQNELNNLASLLDAAVKAGGIAAAKPALAIMAKLEAAVAEVNAPKAPAEHQNKDAD